MMDVGSKGKYNVSESEKYNVCQSEKSNVSQSEKSNPFYNLSVDKVDADKIVSNSQSNLPQVSINNYIEKNLNTSEISEENDKSISDQSSEDMSTALCNLLSAIENENCTDMNHKNTEDKVNQTNTSIISNENFIEYSGESEKIKLNHSDLSSTNELDLQLSGNDFTPPNKKVKLDVIKVQNANSVVVQVAENILDLDSNNQHSKHMKQEKQVVKENTSLNISNVSIKSEPNGDTEENDDDERIQPDSMSISLNDTYENSKIVTLPLPSYLHKIATIKPIVTLTRVRTLPNGSKIKVKAVKYHPLVMSWCFKDTFLASFDKCANLRHRLGLGGTSFAYKDSTISDVHPVDIGSEFPFSFTDLGTSVLTSDQHLPPPLAYLISKKNTIASSRQAQVNGKLKTIPTIKFADEMLDCAGKESLLSKFLDAPDAVEMLNVERTWPECSFEALNSLEVDYKFPFAFKDSIKDEVFLGPLVTTLPDLFFEKDQQLPPVPSHLRKKYDATKNSLLRIMAAASFYMHSSVLSKFERNNEKYLIYHTIGCSMRPIITSQANELGSVVVEIRKYLLSQFSSEEKNVKESLIYGPILLWSYFFGNVKRTMKTPNLLLKLNKT